MLEQGAGTTSTPLASANTPKPEGETWLVNDDGLPERLNLGDWITFQRSHKTNGPWSKDEVCLYQTPDHELQPDEPSMVATGRMPLIMAIKNAIDEDTPVNPLNCNGCGSSGYIKIVQIFRPAKKAAVN